MQWQILASAGCTLFKDSQTLRATKIDVENALTGLSEEIARIAGAKERSGLDRALELRSRPRADHKSVYECLNQLVHYWYCCCAGLHLFELGVRALEMRPTGHGSKASGGRHGFDIEVRDDGRLLICAEVFCVSQALWGQKISKTAKKLVTDESVPAKSHRIIYCNHKDGRVKCTEQPDVVVCSIGSTGAVRLLQSNDPRVTSLGDMMLPSLLVSRGQASTER